MIVRMNSVSTGATRVVTSVPTLIIISHKLCIVHAVV